QRGDSEVRAPDTRPQPGSSARAQERVRRVGVLSNPGPDDAEMQSRTAAFVQGLQELGWTVGRNLQIDFRWSHGSAERLRAHAAELLALQPRPGCRSCRSWRRTAVFQSYLRRRSTRSAWVWSKACPARQATSPASPNSNTAFRRNGWSC